MKITQLYRTLLSLCIALVLLFTLHEVILNVFFNEIKVHQEITNDGCWKYYPVSPHIVIPKSSKLQEGDIRTVFLSVSSKELYSIIDGISSIGFGILNPSNIGENWWNWDANYHKRGKEWEIDGRFNLIPKNDDSFESQIKVRINGNTSRAFPQKSFRISPYEKADKSPFAIRFWDDSSLTRCGRLVLRNLGANWGNVYSLDALVQLSVPRQDIVLKSEPVQLFLNGEYWGIYYLRNKPTSDHTKKIIKPNDQEFANLILDLERVVQTENDVDFNSEVKIFDLNSFYWMIFCHSFFGNPDWPKDNLCIEWNSESEVYTFLLKDFDLVLRQKNEDEIRQSYKNFFRSRGLLFDLFRRLMRIPEYRSEYFLLVNDYLSGNYFPNTCTKHKKLLSSFHTNQSNRWRRYSVEELNQYIPELMKRYDLRRPIYLDELSSGF